MTFAEILRKLRKEKGMSQDDFADFCGLSRPSISRYEAGGKISRESAIKIATACNIDMNTIFAEDIVNEDDAIAAQVQTLLQSMSLDKKKQVLEYLTFLRAQQEK